MDHKTAENVPIIYAGVGNTQQQSEAFRKRTLDDQAFPLNLAARRLKRFHTRVGVGIVVFAGELLHHRNHGFPAHEPPYLFRHVYVEVAQVPHDLLAVQHGEAVRHVCAISHGSL